MKTRTLNMLVDDKGRFVGRAVEHRFSGWQRVLVFVCTVGITIAVLESGFSARHRALPQSYRYFDHQRLSPRPPHIGDCQTFIAYDHNLYRACATEGR
jgi:hypothetical protein